MELRNVLHRLLLLLGTCAFALMAQAQATGIKFVADYLHPLLEGRASGSSAGFGLGVDHDFSDRIGSGLEFRFASSGGTPYTAIELLYNSRYYTTENQSTAFYVGTFIGYQRIIADEDMTQSSSGAGRISLVQIPIGLRIGVRGGLEGFFAEVYAHLGYSIGSGSELYSGVPTRPLFTSLGFALGGGWSH